VKGAWLEYDLVLLPVAPHHNLIFLEEPRDLITAAVHDSEAAYLCERVELVLMGDLIISREQLLI